MDMLVIFLRTALAVVATGALLASCATAPSGETSAAYTLSFAVAAAPGAPASPASAVVLYDGQFLDSFTNSAVLTAVISPEPPAGVSVTWTASNPSTLVQQSRPGYASPAPEAPLLSTFAVGGPSYGVSTLSARASGPVNETASIPAYHYPSLSLGCRFRYSPAFSFDPGAMPNGTSSDLYATAGSDQLGPLDPCRNSPFATAPGTPESWHAPYGGVFMPSATLEEFRSIGASQWVNAGTAFTPQTGVLLFKTKAGLVVKVRLPIGPYEVSGANGQFPY